LLWPWPGQSNLQEMVNSSLSYQPRPSFIKTVASLAEY
jgi:hypothetical protein